MQHFQCDLHNSCHLLCFSLYSSQLFAAACLNYSLLFSTLQTLVYYTYMYIYSSQLFSAPLISPLPRLLYLFSTLFDSLHIVSPLLNSSCVFLAFLTSSHRCRNSYQLFPTSQLFSTRRHFSTLLNSSPLLNSFLLCVFSGFSKGIML